MLKRLAAYIFICLSGAGLLLLCPLAAKAQVNYTLKGITVKAGNADRIAQVKVLNLHTGQVKFSDSQGIFTIAASTGDSLEFSKLDYTVLIQAVASSNDIVIYLNPVVNLNTVVIKGYSTKREQQTTLDAYRSKGVYYNGKPSALSYIASPLNGLYELFGKEPKQARRFNNYIKQENEAIRIDRRFNKSIIKQVTGIPDEELPGFLETYRPQYEKVNKWSDYDLINYIKKSYTDYQALQRNKLKPLTAN